MTDSPFLNEHILKGEQEGCQESRREDATRVDQETDLTLRQDRLDLAYQTPTWRAFQAKFNLLRRAKAGLPQPIKQRPANSQVERPIQT